MKGIPDDLASGIPSVCSGRFVENALSDRRYCDCKRPGMSRTSEHEDDRKRRDERGYTPDGGGGHASGGGKRSQSDEKKQTTGKPSPRRGPTKADR
jgi:hypothetical protein